MEIDLGAAMRSRTDDELLAIVERDHLEFTEEALAAARAELASRGLSPAEPQPQSSPTASAGGMGLTALGGLVVLAVAAYIAFYGVSLSMLGLLIPGIALLARGATKRGSG